MAEFHKGKSNHRRVFVTTDKGHAFLKAYGSLRTTIEKGILKLHIKKLEPISTH